MTNAHRDLATPELWNRSLERSRRRRALLPKARRENNRRKHLSAALATAVVAGPGAPIAAAQVSGDVSTAVAAESPANRAIEIREGGLPLRVGSQGDLVAHVQTKLGVASDGIFGPQTDAAVRKYQLSAGLDVDGIVGPNTWSSLFEQAGASGASLGGSNVPPQVKQEVEQTAAAGGRRAGGPGRHGCRHHGRRPGERHAALRDHAHQPAEHHAADDAGSGGRLMQLGDDLDARQGHGQLSVRPPRRTQPRRHRHRRAHRHAGPAAAACGTVSLAGQQSGYGNIVCVTHTSQFSTCYAHLSRFGVSNGAQVQQGQVIGYVGCTGSCTGPHLHFETRVNGQAQNPSTYLSGGSTIPGKRATVAGTSSSGTTASSTATAAAQPASAESVQSTSTTEPTPVLAETAPSGTVEAQVASAEAARASRGRGRAGRVEAQVAAPAEVAPSRSPSRRRSRRRPSRRADRGGAAAGAAEPVAVEAQVAAPAEVAPEPVAVEARRGRAGRSEPAAPSRSPPRRRSRARRGRRPLADAAADQAQVDAAATAAVQ